MKTPNWTKEELSKVLLKTGKCWDPGGLINEIFKPAVIGTDVQEALLDLFNLCKSEMQITEFMQISNISNIWKKKGDKIYMGSYQGIFIVNIVRVLVFRLIYQD